MIVRSVLPRWPDRKLIGQVGVWDSDKWLVGPFPCLGKSDNEGAALKGNPRRDPKLPWGDHPTGRYEITEVRRLGQEQAYSYGPVMLRLHAISGDCCGADLKPDTKDDRPGLAIHGGKNNGIYQYGFRPTYGCLRLLNEDIESLAAFVESNSVKDYVCEEV